MSYKTFKQLNEYKELIHGFTYKNGGVAELPFGNQHMGVLSVHFREEAWQNVSHLVQELDLSETLKAIVCTEQVHEDYLVKFSTSQSPSTHLGEIPVYIQHKTDGVFTNLKNSMLMTFYADCTPVYFYDPIKKACGMVHSGWKGTALKIAASGAHFMESEFGSALKDLKIVIGPAASKCCYEVDQKVFEAFPEHKDCFDPTTINHYKMDMKTIILKDLINIGLTESQIEITKDCTLCQEELYFSYRKEKGNTGRMAAFMMLK